MVQDWGLDEGIQGLDRHDWTRLSAGDVISWDGAGNLGSNHHSHGPRDKQNLTRKKHLNFSLNSQDILITTQLRYRSNITHNIYHTHFCF